MARRGTSSRTKTTPRRHVSADFFAHVKAKIHFFEIAMQRNGQTEKARIEKEKSDDADKGLAVFVIDLGAGRDERRENLRVDNEVEQCEVTPIGSEKRLHRR